MLPVTAAVTPWHTAPPERFTERIASAANTVCLLRGGDSCLKPEWENFMGQLSDLFLFSF